MSEFTPEMLRYLNPDLELTQGQIRQIQVSKLFNEDFQQKDQIVFILNSPGPNNVKILPCLQAAEWIIDGKARLATDEEAKVFQAENKKAQSEIQKMLDRVDLGKSIERDMQG